MATTGTLTGVSNEPAQKRPNRVAQLAAADIAAAEARAKVLGQDSPEPADAITTPASPAPSDAHDGLSVQSASTGAPDVVGLDDVDMEGAPALRPLKTMRAHQRAAVLAECLALAQKLQGREISTEEGIAGLDPRMLELFGEVDLFMEKHVVDVEAYVAWTTEPEGMDAFLRVVALFGRFTERLGG